VVIANELYSRNFWREGWRAELEAGNWLRHSAGPGGFASLYFDRFAFVGALDA